MKKVDKESKQFITWAMKQLKNEEFFDYLYANIKLQMKRLYLDKERKQLLAELEKKMIKGAIEHGKPSKSFEEVDAEVRQELLDLIGWNMVTLWQYQKNSYEK